MKAAQPGDVLAGRYRLRGVIGQGGMGIVWLAGDELLARDVAIKEAIRPAQFDEADWAVLRERSLREARTAAQLNHPNIVGVYDVFEHDGRPWLVMQLVPYPSLRDVVVNGGPLQPVQAATVGLRVLAAIRAAHTAGILHRDVKPANILLGPDDQVYLTDFGLAVADSNPGVTMAGVIMGSPAYMAPERARSLAASPATDLWALGATLYAAVEGRDPFERNGTMAVLTAIVADEPDAPELSRPAVAGDQRSSAEGPAGAARCRPDRVPAPRPVRFSGRGNHAGPRRSRRWRGLRLRGQCGARRRRRADCRPGPGPAGQQDTDAGLRDTGLRDTDPWHGQRWHSEPWDGGPGAPARCRCRCLESRHRTGRNGRRRRNTLAPAGREPATQARTAPDRGSRGYRGGGRTRAGRGYRVRR